MSTIEAPLFFRKNKAEELNNTVFDNTGCFVFLKIQEFPFSNNCENYRQALYSLIIDTYALFHDCGRAFWTAFANASKTPAPHVLTDLVKYRILLTHSSFEPDFQVLNSFSRLITARNATSIDEYHANISNANESDYRFAYNALKTELDIFYRALIRVKERHIKRSFVNYSPKSNGINSFMLSLNQALIKSILQAESGVTNPNYSSGSIIYCTNGNVEIRSFIPTQQNIINRFNNNQYTSSDQIYSDFRNEVTSLVKPPRQSSAQILNNP